MIDRARFLLLLSATIALVLPPSAPAATGAGDEFAPDTVVTSFTSRTTGRRAGTYFTSNSAWTASQRYRQVTKYNGSAGLEMTFERGARSTTGSGTWRLLNSPSVETRRFIAPPDGYLNVEYLSLDGIANIIARHRSGASTLVATTLNGVAALKGAEKLAGNDCSGQLPGTLTVWLDAATLLPLQSIEKRGTMISRWTARYANVNAPLAESLFTPPPLRDPTRLDRGFHRASPLASSANLRFRPTVPTALPAGFSLAVSGWAAESGVVGPEASFATAPGLFQAVYRRGFEHVDVTERPSTPSLRRNWAESDPLGYECGDETVTDTNVNGLPAKYGAGPYVPPHVWWRNGSVLYTVQGPFSKLMLLAVAGSMTRVA